MIDIAKDIAPEFINGFSCKEVLQNTHKLVRPYRCTLQAGKAIAPELRADIMQFYCFIDGTGFITCEDRAFNIRELSFFIPDFANQAYTIHASREADLEFVRFDIGMLPSDWLAFEDTHYILPWFKPISSCEEYTQTCKGPHTKSYMVLNGRTMARILCGTCHSIGEGTKEKGHPAVDQWNVTLPGADFTLYVENGEVHHGPLEVSYVKAGLDHGLIADAGKTVSYIWFEHYVEEREIDVQSYDENGAKYGHQ